MSKELKKGDKVTWQSHGTTVPGKVEEKITSDTEAAGREVRASKDEPQYRVVSDKSGRDAVHKPESLKRNRPVADDHADTFEEFDDTVNMTAGELEKWLDSDESKGVGQKNGGGEATGHKSGRRIVDILRTKKSDLTDDDYSHMRKVVGYAHRHLAQKPSGDSDDSAWRYSLMNWGHDPSK